MTVFPEGTRDGSAWLRTGWAPALLAVGIVAMLLCLAAANVVVRANWHEVEDGVLWADESAGVVARAVASESPGHVAGLVEGDLLLAINGRAVESRGDVLDILHAATQGERLGYTVLRLVDRQLYELTLEAAPSSDIPLYFVLVGVGIFALLIGTSVRVNRPGTPATLHFFWLTVAFFGVFAFSFSGRFDRLDWAFFWADAISTLLLAPLFIHFALVFPERTPGRWRDRLGRWLAPVIYLPAVLLGMALVDAVTFGQGPQLTRTVDLIWRFELAYLAACLIGGLATMIVALKRVHSVTSRRQLRWIVSGAVFGGLPSTVGYAIPWSLGFEPGARFDLLVVPLCLVPLAFAASIIRYRLHDVEVIVKRGVVYTVAITAMAAIYLALERLASEVFLEESDGHNSIIAFLATLVVVLLAGPVKNAIQTMLDRVYYRDRYDYRRALVGFARDLSRDLDLHRLTERLVSRVAETFVVDRMVLFQAETVGDSPADGSFVPIRWVGFDDAPPAIGEASTLGQQLQGRATLVFDTSSQPDRLSEDEGEVWRRHGLRYFVPCVANEGTIAVMAVGSKENGEPLSSEDMGLLAAVGGQVATALENGRLYGQLQTKAVELDRMRQFSENIIESLNDGLLVFDLEGRVIRWNAGMERLYGLTRADAVGRRLEELFDEGFASRLRNARDDSPAGTAFYRVGLHASHRVVDVDTATTGARSEDAGRLLVNVATGPLVTPGGQTNGTMVIIEDITVRGRLEEQLRISEKMASVGLLAAGVAHEVNTPLTGISSFTQMLLEGADPDHPQTKVLEKIERQTFRAAKIVNGLLNLARPGRPDAAGPVDVNVVVADALALVEPQLSSGSVKVRRELTTDPVRVEGVEFKLQQIFLNLFLNARDAMPTGGWLTIRTRLTDDEALVEVADTGAGIPHDVISRIYDPFFTTKVAGHGTGLGLSITYGVVQEHGGSIACESQPGQGAHFSIRFPLLTPNRDRRPAAAQR